jgi:hypothetical protein
MKDFIENKKRIKAFIKKIHNGDKPSLLKEEFSEILKEVGATEIAKIEEELISEGLPVGEVRDLCDIHLAVFKDTITEEELSIHPGHPLYILLEEHKFVKGLIEELTTIIKKIENADNLQTSSLQIEKLERIVAGLTEYEKHKIREENCLFPALEKQGLTKPPQIMWMDHDEQRKHIKNAKKILENKDKISFGEFKKNILTHFKILIRIIPEHFYKEENILFKASLRLIQDENEWLKIKASMDDLGYCSFTPLSAIGEKLEIKASEDIKGKISLKSGTFTVKELETVLNTLPVDITFVDKDDIVRFFNLTKDRIFPRTTGILGRTVQNCHPQKSIDVVNKIVNEFKEGKRDNAEFWINMDDHLIHIQYFPVKDDEGEYLGVIEVTQDITDIQKLEGERRLLDD